MWPHGAPIRPACGRIPGNGLGLALQFLFFLISYSTLGLPSLDFVAGEALPVVNRDHPAAVGTTVPLVLLAQEGLDAFGADHFEVLNRAYAVAAAITLVEFSQPLAGIAVTFKAESYLVLGQ